MQYVLFIQQEAVLDIQESFVWYEEQQLGLGEDFMQELNDSFQIILANPQFFGWVNKRFRTARLSRFPYRIVFEIEKEKIIVIAVDHYAKDKKY